MGRLLESVCSSQVEGRRQPVRAATRVRSPWKAKLTEMLLDPGPTANARGDPAGEGSRSLLTLRGLSPQPWGRWAVANSLTTKPPLQLPHPGPNSRIPETEFLTELEMKKSPKPGLRAKQGAPQDAAASTFGCETRISGLMCRRARLGNGLRGDRGVDSLRCHSRSTLWPFCS